jgi:hypothetical protein
VCRGSSEAVYVGTAHCHEDTRLPARGHMTKSTEQPRTRGHHTTTLGAQMLELSFKYWQKIQTEPDKKLQEEKTKTEKYLNLKDRSREALPPKTFKEFQEVGKASGEHRENRSTKDVRIPQFTLEPNHSHFIFADDGSLDFGIEAKLRADVLSCFSLKQADVLSYFKGIGIQQMGKKPGAKNKILQRIDDRITRMHYKLNKGWEKKEMPCPEVHRCTGLDCHRYIWAVQTKCVTCLSIEAIKEKLQHSPAFKPIFRADALALMHFFSNQFKDPIKIESNQKLDEIEKQIEKHKDALKRLSSNEDPASKLLSDNRMYFAAISGSEEKPALHMQLATPVLALGALEWSGHRMQPEASPSEPVNPGLHTQSSADTLPRGLYLSTGRAVQVCAAPTSLYESDQHMDSSPDLDARAQILKSMLYSDFV